MTNVANKYSLPRFFLKTRKGKHGLISSMLYSFLSFLIIGASFAFFAWGAKEMTEPFNWLEPEKIALAPHLLLEYSLRTILRMIIAVIFSLMFTLIYATIAAKSRLAEQFLIPALDVLQSIPILGYISFTVTGFLALFPGSVLGLECAAIFAIFTSQAWNMTFSFYQSLKSLPQELHEAAAVFNMSAWQKFWRIELPYGIPGLIWNTVVSMSSSWFFVVASEAIVVGSKKISIPGIGSYIALAVENEDLKSIGYAVLTMIAIILLCDQLVIRPLISWSEKFRYEMTSNQNGQTSWILTLLKKSMLIGKLRQLFCFIGRAIVYLPLLNRPILNNKIPRNIRVNSNSKFIDYCWYSALFLLGAFAFYHLFVFLDKNLDLIDVLKVLKLTSITFLRVIILIIIASIIWVPVGIYIGLRPSLTSIVQPLAQFLAAFPANLLFPVVVMIITKYKLNHEIWLSFLMIIGTQWYILFNVIAGAAAFPEDFKEAIQMLNLKGWLLWRRILLPAIMPHYITGAITASGGAWNASIVAEFVNFGDQQLIAQGIGSYIVQMTLVADFHRLVLGIGMMSFFVVFFNRLFWQPLHDYCNKKFQL